MNREDRAIDELLRRHVERQLRDFDWDQLRGRIAGRLGRTTGRAPFRPRAWSFRIVSAAAAVAAVALVTALFCWRSSPNRSPSLLEQITAGRVDAGPLGPALDRTDYLIADTSPRTVLLTGQTHLVCSDPLLRPHSVWEQEPMPTAAAHIKEKWR
jgi:hypothetical protein